LRLLLVTDMAPDFVKRLLLTPCATLDAALALAVKDVPAGSRIGVMPWANTTIPALVQ